MINIRDAHPSSYLREDLERCKALFEAQPALVQRYLEAQARQLAPALLDGASYFRFSLPDRIVDSVPYSGEQAAILVPDALREQSVGGWWNRAQNTDAREQLRQKLNALEQTPDQAVSTGAKLLRFATAFHMVHHVLPAGRSITYCAEDGEEIPTVPLDDGAGASAITAAADAIVETGSPEQERGELQVPYVPAARRFYIPQWVALDDEARLLVNSVAEAETCLASMQRYVMVLHRAVALAPYMVADDEYQRKRYGMLGQLVHQGRALARFKVNEIIRVIKERAQAGKLNRGLSLSLPYFDDQELGMRTLDFDVIPGGRIRFIPVFVVRAAHLEQATVAQDTRLNASTRKYLLTELKLLESAFYKEKDY